MNYCFEVLESAPALVQHRRLEPGQYKTVHLRRIHVGGRKRVDNKGAGYENELLLQCLKFSF